MAVGSAELAILPGRSRPSTLTCAWPALRLFGDDVHEPHPLDLTNVASQPVRVALTGPHLHWPLVHKQSDNRHRLMRTRRESAESGQPTHLPKVPLPSECRNARGGGIDVRLIVKVAVTATERRVDLSKPEFRTGPP